MPLQLNKTIQQNVEVTPLQAFREAMADAETHLNAAANALDQMFRFDPEKKALEQSDRMSKDKMRALQFACREYSAHLVERLELVANTLV